MTAFTTLSSRPISGLYHVVWCSQNPKNLAGCRPAADRKNSDRRRLTTDTGSMQGDFSG